MTFHRLTSARPRTIRGTTYETGCGDVLASPLRPGEDANTASITTSLRVATRLTLPLPLGLSARVVTRL